MMTSKGAIQRAGSGLAATTGRRMLAGLLGLIWGLSAFAEPARAACSAEDFAPTCESWAFTASVSSLADPLALFGPIGTSFAGVVTLETDIADTIAGSSVGFYPGAVECAFVDFEEQTLEVLLDLQTPDEEIGIEVMNDIPSSGGGFDVESDTLTAEIVGFGDVAGLLGLAGVGFGYGEGCFELLGNCPPTILVDDAIPTAPGDLSTPPRAGDIVVRFTSLTGAQALVGGILTNLSSRSPVPCPEPALGSGLAVALLFLGALRRRRR